MWWFHRRSRRMDDSGVTAVEYGLIMTGVGIVSIAGLFVLNNALSDGFDSAMTGSGACSGAGCDAYSSLPTPVGGSGAPVNLDLLTYAPLIGAEGSAFTSTPVVTGGTAPFTYAASGLPGSLSIDTGTGVVSGSPTAGSYPVTVTITDATSASDSLSVAFTISPTSPAPSLTGYAPTAGTLGDPFTSSPSVTGGASPLTFAVTSGALPGGLTIASSSGVVSGTPTATGSFPVTITVTDANSATDSVSTTFTVSPSASAPDLVSYSPLTATAGSPLFSSPSVTGGTAPLTYAITSGSLPGGVTLAPGTGVLSGTPTAAGSFPVTVTVTDATTATDSLSLTLTVAPAVALTGYSPTSGVANTALTSTPTVNGGTAPLAYTVSSGTLPSGLTLNTNTGVVSGIPTSAGTTALDMTVTDANGSTSTVSVTFTITQPVCESVAPAPTGSVKKKNRTSYDVFAPLAGTGWSFGSVTASGSSGNFFATVGALPASSSNTAGWTYDAAGVITFKAANSTGSATFTFTYSKSGCTAVTNTWAVTVTN